MNGKIFISYQRQDSMQDADRVRHYLQDAGFSVWMDTQRLDPAQTPWEETLQRALAETHCLIVLITPNMAASTAAQFEWEYAIQLGRPILPVLVTDEDMPPLLHCRQYVDLRDQFEQGMQTLIDKLQWLCSDAFIQMRQHILLAQDDPPPNAASTHELGKLIEHGLWRTQQTLDDLAEFLEVEPELLEAIISGLFPASEIDDDFLEELAFALDIHIRVLRAALRRGPRSENGILDLYKTIHLDLAAASIPTEQATLVTTYQMAMEVYHQYWEEWGTEDSAWTNLVDHLKSIQQAAFVELLTCLNRPANLESSLAHQFAYSLFHDVQTTYLAGIYQHNRDHWWGVSLAAYTSLLEDSSLTPDSSCKSFTSKLAAKIETSFELTALDRVIYGQTLGLFGDPRLGVGIDDENHLPTLVWCDIPAVQLRYSENRVNDDLISNFKMSRYPITVIQFQAFIDDSHDLFNNQLATRRSNIDTENSQARNSKIDHFMRPYFDIPNHPRTHVTWYEAIAFCHWLTRRYRDSGFIAQKEIIRLPTEHEWEYAARGTDQRLYPWGNRYQCGYAQVHEPSQPIQNQALQMTSAVGLYPEGASPFGVFDMSGNVWEWCLNKFNQPEVIDIDDTDDLRILKGGSWRDTADQGCVTSRLVRCPSEHADNIGFRVVRSTIAS